MSMERIIYLGDSTVTYNHIATWPQTGLSQGLLLYLKDDVFVMDGQILFGKVSTKKLLVK